MCLFSDYYISLMNWCSDFRLEPVRKYLVKAVSVRRHHLRELGIAFNHRGTKAMEVFCSGSCVFCCCWVTPFDQIHLQVIYPSFNHVCQPNLASLHRCSLMHHRVHESSTHNSKDVTSTQMSVS